MKTKIENGTKYIWDEVTQEWYPVWDDSVKWNNWINN